MKQLYPTNFTFTFRLLPLYRNTSLFLLIFLLNFTLGFGQQPENTVPEYDHFNWVDLVNQTILNLDTDELPISIDVSPDNYLYILTFGNGVEKRNSAAELEQSNFISGLSSPLDMAIDSEGYFYIADYSEDEECSKNGKIKIFTPTGALDRIIYTGIYRPIGIEVDSEKNIYVAEYNQEGNGCEGDELSRVSAYSNSGSRIAENSNVLRPYRIAVSSDKTVYVSQEGGNDPAVLTLDGNLNITGRLPNIQSPGSIKIDDFGFIHVVEYAGRIDFSNFLNIENLGLGEIQDIAEEIDSGIDDEAFFIRIYNQAENYRNSITEEIDFPVDIAFNSCNRMFVNNAYVDGETIIFLGYFPEEFEFDLEIYERTPSLDTKKPIALCKSGLEFTLENGEVTITAGQIDGGSTDNCEIESLELSQYTFDEARDYDIELTVTDAAGNFDTCETTITILPGDEEETPPEANCNSFEITLDSNGEASITADQVYSGSEDLLLEIDKENFTCEDIGENEVILTVKDSETELTNTCTATITVSDNQAPLINCVAEGKEFQLENGSVTIAVADIELSSSDNCSISTKSLSETTFTTSGTKNITLTVIDEAGNISDCSTDIEILPEEDTYNFECIGALTVNLGEDVQNSGVEEIPTLEFIISDTSNLDFELTNQQFICEDIGTNPLTIRATNKTTGEAYSCEVEVTVVDVGAPLIICPAEPITTNLPEGGYEVPNFFENRVSDNCNSLEELELVQDVEPGTVLDEAGTYTINLTTTDTYNNVETCEITIILEENDPVAPEIECVSHELFLDENGQVTLDPEDIFAGERGNLVLSTNIQDFDCSNLGENTVILTATDPDTGLSSSCPTEVFILDDIFPEANCVAPGREFRLQNGSVTISPSAIDLNSEDNCEITRTLSEDTFTTPGTKNITLYINDADGNADECSTSIEILPENTNSPTYRCIEEEDIPDIRLDENCERIIPDYTRLIETENFTAEFTQTYEQLTENTLYFTIEIRNEANGELVGECSFSANIIDLMPPKITCPGDQVENFDPEEGFVIPDYENMASFSDNCGEVTFQQRPAPGEVIFEDTMVTLTAFDENGLATPCTFEIQLSQGNELNITCQIDQNVNPNEDCRFTLPDYTDTASINLPGAEVTQSPAPGTVISENTQIKLTATLDRQTDECVFMVNLIDNEDPVANCVSGYVVNLDSSGNATLAPEVLDNNSTDNCGIVSMALSQTEFTRADIGEVPITLTVRDDAGNMDTCETTVEVVDEASGEFQCRENVVVNLNENGEAVLSLQELYTGNASGITLEASRLNFSCSDLGAVQIQLDYSGAQTGSCTINVEVRDEIPPVINTDIVELTLDDQGFAYLEENDMLAEDNCSQQLIYRFSKSVFNCKDVGSNTVNVEVEDANGNIAEKNIEVRVNGEACEIPDNEDLEFLFIYPNPNNGIFTIATPEGMLVEQVRVFDSRGRFILQKEYKDIARFYRMTIESVAASVYTLQIFTNEGVIVKRVIISL
ncbi:T9SS type A sorting domain-containing protein [Salegentibacter salarius]|uniref:HYR domain-containing protein n=1 Tax=Salegentibacter salarius TaxID=435906 RepID=A0A2N0TXP6_9FLAO|nr:T9SS type A sorting domain-containing protein [Salegentibacter salarius]OEY73182.1 hypothetical protein BHS39_10565 [Salegentibacter salarius]PKD19514.1 hypothetical protein APR40_10545 [Salegentibacter salarius]SLJ98873.1 Por secretion system C-terminal sorting domain-containing protein [Salegentibacter salarius]